MCVRACVRACVRVCVCVFPYNTLCKLFWSVFYMCIEYCIYVKMYHVSAQGVDERMVNVHYYYYYARARSPVYCH